MGLSVLENVMVGLYLFSKSTWVDVLLKSQRLIKRESEAREKAYEAIKLVDDKLAENAGHLVAELSYPDRREWRLPVPSFLSRDCFCLTSPLRV